MINTNLAPTLHPFRDIAFDRSKIAIYSATALVFNSPDGGFPWDDLRKILPGCQYQSTKWRRNIAENFNRLSIGCTNVTDRRQTTDGRTTTYSERSSPSDQKTLMRSVPPARRECFLTPRNIWQHITHRVVPLWSYVSCVHVKAGTHYPCSRPVKLHG